VERKWKYMRNTIITGSYITVQNVRGWSSMNDKSDEERFSEILYEMYQTYKAKNQAYGNAYKRSRLE